MGEMRARGTEEFSTRNFNLFKKIHIFQRFRQHSNVTKQIADNIYIEHKSN